MPKATIKFDIHQRVEIMNLLRKYSGKVTSEKILEPGKKSNLITLGIKLDNDTYKNNFLMEFRKKRRLFIGGKPI